METFALFERADDTVQGSVTKSPLLSNPNLEAGPDHPSAEEFQSSDTGVSTLSERVVDTVQESVKRSSLMSNPILVPRPDHPNTEEFHSSDMEVSKLSECAADFEGHPENVKIHVGEKEEALSDSRKVQTGEEQDSSNSSCMVILKPPSLESTIPSSSKKVLSLSTKKTYKLAAYDNNETSESCMTKRGRIDYEARALALERAEELQKNLPSEHLSFIKQMLSSNVTKYFQLILPVEFCNVHLPKQDAEITLEDESGETFKLKFHPRKKKRLSGGWHMFSAVHKLLEGDVVVFHLLRPCYFKVYIVRVNEQTVVGNTNLASPNLHVNEGPKRRKSESADRKPCWLALPVDTVQESVKSVLSNPSLDLGRDDSMTDELHSSDIEASPLSGLDADFENFKIVVNDVIIDPELSRSTRFRYYKLCCSRASYLHKDLLKNVNSTLAAGIITGTLEVADAIRASKLSTSKDDFAMWDNTLEGFTTLGMDVGFLRERLKELASLESEFRETEKVKGYVEAKNKRDCSRKEMASVERKFLELKRVTEKLEDETKNMKMNIIECKDTFQEKASAPW